MPRVPTCKSVVFSIMALLIFLSTSSAAQSRQADAVQSLYQKAREAESRKNYQEATGYYEQILKLDPTLHTLRAN
ncbi:MAG: tetratricopeptide repeat protein, partial [Acidobacteria bacterium]|nr:tetratricopeptide repeat protein [Acidobacteriota bacterium]